MQQPPRILITSPLPQGFGFKHSLEDMCKDFAECLSDAFGTADGESSPLPEISSLFNEVADSKSHQEKGEAMATR